MANEFLQKNGELLLRDGAFAFSGSECQQACCDGCSTFYRATYCSGGCGQGVDIYVCSTANCPGSNQPLQNGQTISPSPGLCYRVDTSVKYCRIQQRDGQPPAPPSREGQTPSTTPGGTTPLRPTSARPTGPIQPCLRLPNGAQIVEGFVCKPDCSITSGCWNNEGYYGITPCSASAGDPSICWVSCNSAENHPCHRFGFSNGVCGSVNMARWSPILPPGGLTPSGGYIDCCRCSRAVNNICQQTTCNCGLRHCSNGTCTQLCAPGDTWCWQSCCGTDSVRVMNYRGWNCQGCAPGFPCPTMSCPYGGRAGFYLEIVGSWGWSSYNYTIVSLRWDQLPGGGWGYVPHGQNGTFSGTHNPAGWNGRFCTLLSQQFTLCPNNPCQAWDTTWPCPIEGLAEGGSYNVTVGCQDITVNEYRSYPDPGSGIYGAHLGYQRITGGNGACTTCNQPVNPPPVTGACCVPGGGCQQKTSFECAQLGGTFAGNGSHCVDVECPPMSGIGACCKPDGTCGEMTESACSAIGGFFTSIGQTCSMTACPSAPPGRCCMSDGSCQDGYSQATCEQVLLGTWGGAFSVCQGFNCPATPRGACCFASGGSCWDNTTAMECQSWGGNWAGENTLCGQGVCPTGCCCTPWGWSAVTSPQECAGWNGHYYGNGTTCDGISCYGRCCQDNGNTCNETTLSDCETIQGSWGGFGTTCPCSSLDMLTAPQPMLNHYGPFEAFYDAGSFDLGRQAQGMFSPPKSGGCSSCGRDVPPSSTEGFLL